MPLFTTTTRLAKNTRAEFANITFATVLANNEPVGMIVSQEIAEHMEASGLLDQIREELWELHDTNTKALVKQSRKWKAKTSVSLKDFREKYARI